MNQAGIMPKDFTQLYFIIGTENSFKQKSQANEK